MLDVAPGRKRGGRGPSDHRRGREPGVNFCTDRRIQPKEENNSNILLKSFRLKTETWKVLL